MNSDPNQSFYQPFQFSLEGRADYTQLDQLLRVQKWKEADLETRRLMLSIVGAEQRVDCLLTQNDLEQFPCIDLRTIDRLWVHYSQRQFGFSIINAIYQEVDQDYLLLAERVGWRRGDEWISYNKITFNTSTPVGHLPLTWLVPTSFWMYWSARFAFPGWRLLLERVENCQSSTGRESVATKT
jgi:hypothetical protein